MSSIAASSVPSVFDTTNDINKTRNDFAINGLTAPTSRNGSDSPIGEASYDLRPPIPSSLPANAELLADRLFSEDHLRLILRHPNFAARFATFLDTYRQQSISTWARYRDAQKAMAAIAFANAITGLGSTDSADLSDSIAAMLDEDFEIRLQSDTDELLTDTLPAFVTHQLVQIVTECLVKEVTGNSAPIMRDMVVGLAEVYCLSDPSLPDNPIVYASEEFYRTAQYGQEHVLGRNCRFLQGPKTLPASISRLAQATSTGQEICETVLNYRRDGSPFLNLLMIAPLFDNRGVARYYIGCQIDVTNLLDRGRALDSFRQLLDEDLARLHKHQSHRMTASKSQLRRDALRELTKLSSLLNNEEVEAINSGIKSRTAISDDSRSFAGTVNSRRVIGMDDVIDKSMWPAPQYGPSGRLPGVYQNYLLVRPYPSLRITFTSPTLRMPGMGMSRFLDRIGGSAQVRDGLLEAFAAGVSVTARVTWLAAAPRPHEFSAQSANSARSLDSGNAGRIRWLHCTPLRGADGAIGIWMVVMVENEAVTGRLTRRPQRMPSNASREVNEADGLMTELSIEGGKGSESLIGRNSRPSTSGGLGPNKARYYDIGLGLARPGLSLYADYLRRDSRSGSAEGKFADLSNSDKQTQ